MPTYVAESERLWLQELNVKDHLEGFFKLSSDPEATFWSTKPPHTTPAQTQALIEDSFPTPAKPWNRKYAIMLRPIPTPTPSSPDHEAPATMIGVLGTPRPEEIAYKLLPAYWGKGYMPEAIKMFLEMWWSQPENATNNHILAYTDAANTGSQRVLTKTGFKKGKLFQDHYVRAVDAESGKRSSLQLFWLGRPGREGEGDGDGDGDKGWLEGKVPMMEGVGEKMVEGDGGGRGDAAGG